VDLARAVPAALEKHPAVHAVRLVGSRATGRAHELSDWDFLIGTNDFRSVEGDRPALVASLAPLSEQRDPYSDRACYMLLLRGPTKIDLIFPGEKRRWSPAWAPSPETLEAIDRHFWDWILWLEQKRRGGRRSQLEKSLRDLFELMLGPMGVVGQPRSSTDAVDSYLAARSELELQFGTRVPRVLEEEVRPVLMR